jgi:homoserine kinase type II
MSVYTRINQQQLEDLLRLYSLGTAIDFKGIEAGIENTNYFVTTTKGAYVLTIFELITAEELPFYVNLLQHLKQKNLPVPTPQKSLSGHFFHQLLGKPVAFFNRLSGHSVAQPSAIQCAEMGSYLAKLHLSSPPSQSEGKVSNTLLKSRIIFNQIKSNLSAQDISLITSELGFQESHALISLPKGIIHADLFRDNVLFNQGHVSGILDFYDANDDYFLLDIAITCNDWCVENSSINQDKFRSFLDGYSTIRRLTEEETSHLPAFLRLAALRFWLSRLSRQLAPKESDLTLEKDPLVFRHMLVGYR